MNVLKAILFKITSFFLGVAILIGAAWIFFPNTPAVLENEPEFRLVGYFKSSVKDRIFTIEMPAGITLAEFGKYATRQPVTDGQMTAVYGYSKNSVIPSDGVSLAAGVFEVNDVIALPGLSRPQFSFMAHRNGNRELVDCTTDPSSALCFNR